MTNQEFKSLTNIEVSPELFKLIHAIYMACGDSMTKADFCADYKSIKIAPSSLLYSIISASPKASATTETIVSKRSSMLQKRHLKTILMLPKIYSLSPKTTLLVPIVLRKK